MSLEAAVSSLLVGSSGLWLLGCRPGNDDDSTRQHPERPGTACSTWSGAVEKVHLDIACLHYTLLASRRQRASSVRSNKYKGKARNAGLESCLLECQNYSRQYQQHQPFGSFFSSSSFRLIPKKLMSSYTGMEECQKTNTTTKRKM